MLNITYGSLGYMFSYIKYKARGEIQRLPQIVMVADLSNCHSTVVWPIKNTQCSYNPIDLYRQGLVTEEIEISSRHNIAEILPSWRYTPVNQSKTQNSPQGKDVSGLLVF